MRFRFFDYLFPAILFILLGCSLNYVPVAVSNTNSSIISAALTNISSFNIMNIFTNLNHIRNVRISNILLDDEMYIMSNFSGFGLKTNAYPVTFKYTIPDPYHNKIDKTSKMDNLEAIQVGSIPSLAPVFITGHWDSGAITPGVDDNLSAVASILEIARILKNYSFQRSIYYLLFSYEEEGMVGSYAYVSNMTRLPLLVLNLDSIAYTTNKQMGIGIANSDVGDYILVAGMEPNIGTLLDYCHITDKFVTGLKYIAINADAGMVNNPLLINILRSDHTPFAEKGVPFLVFTDMANFRNVNYHTSNDTINTIDIPFMIKVAKSVMATAMIKAELR